MCYVGVGQSWQEDSREAGAEAARLAWDQMGQEWEPQFALVFGDVKYDQQKMLDGITSVLGQAPMIGCSGAAQISPAGASTGSVVVMALKSDRHVDVQTGIGQGISQDDFAAGQVVARQVLAPLPETSVYSTTVVKSGDRFIEIKPYTFIMLPDGLAGDGNRVLEGALSVLGPTFQVIGGSAADDFSFEKTYQYHDGRAYSDAVAGALFITKIPTAVGVGHGWRPIGKSMIVTKSEGNVVQELDGKPAIRAYEELFGVEAQELIEQPLGNMALTNPLGIPDVMGGYRLRHPIRAFEDGSISCAATIPENAVVRIMTATLDENVTAVHQAAERALEGLGRSEPVVAIVFDCGARFMLRGHEGTQREIEEIRRVIGEEIPIVGFFTFGEQAPTLGGPVGFHNETCVIYLIGE